MVLLTEDKPKEALSAFNSLYNKYTNKPIILYYVIQSLYLNKKNRKAEDLLIYANQKFSDHTLIKNQYLWYLLEKNRYNEIEKILDNKFTLQDLFPHKEFFTEIHSLNFFKFMFMFLLTTNPLKAKAVLFNLKIFGLEEMEEEVSNKLLLHAIGEFINKHEADK